MHIYDARYYRYINDGSTRSAGVLLPIVTSRFDVNSVVDFGAGQGAWLSVWQGMGVSDVTAVDGGYVDAASLLVPLDRFVAADLRQPLRLGRTFDLVQSLEVAEHLPASAAEVFVDNLVAHGSVILFSAAVPGQGGEHHVNERPYAYWRSLFSRRGYAMLDLVRPFIAGNSRVEKWYRFNTFVFIDRLRLERSDAYLRQFLVSPEAPVPDMSPLAYRLRRAALSNLPVWAVTTLAVARKHTLTRLAAITQTASP